MAEFGGGGGGGTPIADTAEAYWLAGTGARWVYHLTDLRPGADPRVVLKTVEDLGPVTVAGQSVRHFRHSWSLFDREPEDEYRAFDGRAIRSLAVDGSGLGAGAAPQFYAEVPAPLVAGVPVTVVDQTESVDLNNDGLPETTRILVTTTLGIEPTLSVPAGDFRELLRARQQISATLTIGGLGLTETVTGALTTWYAPGIGVVRRAYEDPSEAAPGNLVIEELAGVAAGAIRAGTVPGLVALDGIGYGSSSDAPQGVGIAAGGGRVMTVAVSEAGAVAGAIHGLDGSLVWRGTVLSTGTPYRLAAAAVAFDGTHFRVVASRTNPTISPTENSLHAQRVGTDGTLVGGAAEGVRLDLATGLANTGDTLAGLHAAARDGNLLVAWGRFGLSGGGWQVEGRLYDVQHLPLAEGFVLGVGIPGAVAARSDRFVLVNDGANGTQVLGGWAIAADGVPVSTDARVIDAGTDTKGWPRLQPVGTDLWLSYAKSVVAPSEADLTVVRLGSDAAPVPGSQRTLVTRDVRGLGAVALGATRSLLAWTEGWDRVAGTPFDTTLLSAATALPAAGTPLVVADPLGTSAASRHLVTALDVDGTKLVAWIDNEQSATAASDRVAFTLVYPRYVAP